jgi:hypothetical protein
LALSLHRYADVYGNLNFNIYSKLEKKFATGFKISFQVLKNAVEKTVLSFSIGLKDLYGLGVFSDYAKAIFSMVIFDKTYYKGSFLNSGFGRLSFSYVPVLGKGSFTVRKYHYLLLNETRPFFLNTFSSWDIFSQMALAEKLELYKAQAPLCEEVKAAF